MVGTATVDVVEIEALQLLGDWAAGAVADAATVQFADGRYFGGGAGKEGFVGDVDLIAGDALFVDFQPSKLMDGDLNIYLSCVNKASFRSSWNARRGNSY